MNRRLLIGPLLALLALAWSVPAADKDEAKVKLSKEEQAILDLTNKEREKEKLPPLKPDPTLFKVARAHSKNMATQEKMAHVLDDKNPSQRVKEAGYDYSWVGENVAFALPPDVNDIFKGWMESKLHRENIIRKEYQEIGIGVVVNKKGEAYYTQVFGTPRKKR